MKGDVCITISEASPDKPEEEENDRKVQISSPPQFLTPLSITRRRSFNIIHRRGSSSSSSSKDKKLILPSSEILRRRSVREKSTHAVKNSPPKQPPKEFIIKKPEKTKVLQQDSDGTISILAEQVIPSDINIFLTKSFTKKNSPTELSRPTNKPEKPIQIQRSTSKDGVDSTIVHALVHRESEEYNIDEEGS